MSLFVI